MVIEKIFNFKPTDFGKDGFHKKRYLYLFFDFFKDCEKEFHKELQPYYSNAFFANYNTLLLLKSCFNAEEKEIFGMESVDDDINIELNLEIEKHSENKTVYAIGSNIEGRDDEPIFLIIDNDFSDTQFSFKYISDNDEENILENIPILQSPVKILLKK
jgi:hypothetical protein